jgi:adenylate kinase family enzyme
MQAGSLVPDEVTMELLKKAMLKHQDTNRFLLDGFPRSLQQAKRFEQDVAEVAFVINFEASHDVMKERIAARAVAAPGRVDDNPETVEKRLKTFDSQTKPVVGYYGPIGKLRTVNAEQPVEEVYEAAKRHFSCRFLYLLGPPGAPMVEMSKRLDDKYGYAQINFPKLLQDYAESEAEDAPKCSKRSSKARPSRLQSHAHCCCQRYTVTWPWASRTSRSQASHRALSSHSSLSSVCQALLGRCSWISAGQMRKIWLPSWAVAMLRRRTWRLRPSSGKICRTCSRTPRG